MFHEIEQTRLQLGLCPARLLLLARYSAKRENISAITDLGATERFDLLELLKTMRDYGRPVSYRCVAAAG